MMRLTGSSDIYKTETRGESASVNFITCHDGFTLFDLYSYNHKHNEANGWGNTDGTDDNRSWNCGFEGYTDDPQILALRLRLCRNACAVLMMSRGTPMFLAGDEFLNTQFGNNNAYCIDDETSWVDWSMLDDDDCRDMFKFWKAMIALRKAHDVVRGRTEPAGCGFNDISVHGQRPYSVSYGNDDHYIGVMYAGRDKDGRDDIVYVGMNMWWNHLEVELPKLPSTLVWRKAVSTWENPFVFDGDARTALHKNTFGFGPRSVAVFEGGYL
jgi:glycogen operon protein